MGDKRIVYVFQNLKTTDVVNLQEIASFAEIGYPELGEIPYFGLRGIAQKGLLLFGTTREDPDMRKHVTGFIHLNPGDWPNAMLTAQGYEYHKIIPPPDIDRFYAALLKERAATASEFHRVTEHIIEYV
jgi:hypothetical protein